MKTSLRLTLALVFCVALLLCFAPGASAESRTWGSSNNLTWELDNGLLTIGGEGEMPTFVVETVGEDGHIVANISSTPWSAHNYEITSVVIESGVTNIGGAVFYGCSLETVEIPSSVTSIDDYAFYNCRNLTLTIPLSVTSIGKRAFSGCNSLTSVTIPSNVKTVGGLAFEDCNGLTNVTFSEGVETIGDFTFLGTDLTSVTIPVSVTSIGTWSFYSESGLDIYYGGSRQQWRSLNESSSGFVVGEFTLHCQVPDTWGNLTWTLENGVLTISGEGEMLGFAVETVDEEGNPVTIASSEAWRVYIIEITSVIIEEGVTSIGDYAFTWCFNLSSVEIPAGVTSIGDNAFTGAKLTSVTIPSSVESIGEYAFMSCSDLKSLTISGGVESIGDWAFSGCGSLEGVTIPSSVTSIGDWAFMGCNSMKNLTISEGVENIGNNAFGVCSSLSSVTIPSSVISIDDAAFFYCGLTSVSIPASVASIGDNPFAACSNLTNIEVDEANRMYCNQDGVLFNKGTTELICCPAGLTGVYAIPASVESIGGNAFTGCAGLTSVIIPEGITGIGESAFSGCDNLENVYYGGTSDQWNALCADGIADGNESLTSATIHFIGVPDLILPSALTEIGDEAFMGGAFTFVKLSENSTTIGENAFADCPNLMYIFVPRMNADIDEDAFGTQTELTIFGKAGGDVQSYAEDHGFTFVAAA